MTHRGAAKLLAWLLSPLALLGGLVFIFLFRSLSELPHSGPWEGESFGSDDWFRPYFIPSLLIYLFLGLVVWCLLISFAYLSDNISLRPAVVWVLLLDFNILASLYWIFLAYHFNDPRFGNPGWYPLYLPPLAVTIPVAVMAGRFLFKAIR